MFLAKFGAKGLLGLVLVIPGKCYRDYRDLFHSELLLHYYLFQRLIYNFFFMIFNHIYKFF